MVMVQELLIFQLLLVIIRRTLYENFLFFPLTVA